MGPKSRANRVAFRRAVWASIALHAVAACVLIPLTRTGEQKSTEPGIDTHAANEPQVRMSLSDVALDVEPPAQPATSAPESVPAAPQPEPPQPTAPTNPQVTGTSGPLAVSRPAPQTLPSELLALIRRSAPATETPRTPNSPITDPNVRPAVGANAVGAIDAVPAIHGALDPNRTVVYVLDCSGSMGASGKLDAARAALVATLKQQPTSVRFQVIVYAGAAAPLLPGNGVAVPATGANVRAAADGLAKLEARGQSNHPGAVRAALAFRPDVILLLTDADDLNAAELKRVAAAQKSVSLWVGQVTPEGVQRSRELK